MTKELLWDENQKCHSAVVAPNIRNAMMREGKRNAYAQQYDDVNAVVPGTNSSRPSRHYTCRGGCCVLSATAQCQHPWYAVHLK